MNCESLEPKILDYLDGELTPEERQQLEEHLAHCEICSARLACYKQQDQLLKKYFNTLSQVPLTTPRPRLHINQSPAPRLRVPYQLLAAASFLIVIFLAGLFTFLHYQSTTKSKTGVEIGTVTKVMGKVQYFGESKLQPVTRGMKITSRTRLKIPANSYLEVQLVSLQPDREDNIIEFKDNTLASFHEYNNRIELALEQGEVWVHLNQKPPKPVIVKTRNLVINERGTIFNVAQGITGTAVGVVTGSVEFSLNGKLEVVQPAQFFTTFENKSGDNLYRHILWSHYREKLLALLPKEQLENAQMIATAQLLQVPEVPKVAAPTPEPSSSEEFCRLETTELLPVHTRLFFEIASVPNTIREWEVSDYRRLLQEPALVQWWYSDSMQKFREKINDKIGIPRWLVLFDAISGSLSVGVTPNRGLIIVADCRNNVDQVKELLQTEIQPLLEIWNKNMSESPALVAQLVKGYLVIGREPELLQKTIEAIKKDEPTGFTESQFYQNLRANVPNSRLTIAYDFRSTIQNLKKRGDAGLNKFLVRSGLDNLNYVLGSPDFAGRGINQAFRIAFTDSRQGVLGWLDEPGPLGSLRFFSPDTHLLLAARIKRPEVMLADIINWMREDFNPTPEEEAAEKEEVQFVQQFAACFGNEIAIGLKNPVLPVPNIQIAIELLDEIKFDDLLLSQIDKFNSANPDRKIVMKAKNYRDHLIVTLSSNNWKVDISYVVLQDFLVLGPGEPFLRHTIDIFKENNSLMDEYAFTQQLPQTGQLNVSFLLYQDLARSMPQILKKVLAGIPNSTRSRLPDFEFMSRYRAAGISYAISGEKYIDFYIKGSGGVDFNMGGALPLVASLIMPQLISQDLNHKLDITQARLKATASALESFYDDYNRYPEILEELTPPASYLDAIPEDPFSENGSKPIYYSVNQTKDAYVLYSVGPDGIDGLGSIAYDPSNGTTSAGDIILRGQRRNP